ncbi:unnamed protein product [Prorocentrum cordatum]|uniref:Uncharacterized protein n=1 Tax=Prorocentrum cordatum TaxID=2364126 RepID=A0ABN9YII7_9DINO|nr:unnamed protein product [Polarella glacialis]
MEAARWHEQLEFRGQASQLVVSDALFLGGATLESPSVPTEPGCFVWLPSGCPGVIDIDREETILFAASVNTSAWLHDAGGEKQSGAPIQKHQKASRKACEARAQHFKMVCAVDDAEMLFVEEGALHADQPAAMASIELPGDEAAAPPEQAPDMADAAQPAGGTAQPAAVTTAPTGDADQSTAAPMAPAGSADRPEAATAGPGGGSEQLAASATGAPAAAAAAAPAGAAGQPAAGSDTGEVPAAVAEAAQEAEAKAPAVKGSARPRPRNELIPKPLQPWAAADNADDPRDDDLGVGAGKSDDGLSAGSQKSTHASSEPLLAPGPPDPATEQSAKLSPMASQVLPSWAPSLPKASGCYVWTPQGCPRQPTFHADVWKQDKYGELHNHAASSKAACFARAQMFNDWCGTTSVVMVLVLAPAVPVATRPDAAYEGIAQSDAPDLPTEAGCYVWTPSGCSRHASFHARYHWKRDLEGEARSSAAWDPAACQARKATFDAWCGVQDAVMRLVRPEARRQPEQPAQPGCYVWQPSGCPSRGVRSSFRWKHDRWAEQNAGARYDAVICSKRKATFDNFCGTSDAEMAFVAEDWANRYSATPEDDGRGHRREHGGQGERLRPRPSAPREEASDLLAPPAGGVRAPLPAHAGALPADAEAAPPAQGPTEPGCFAWVPGGCHGHGERGPPRLQQQSGHEQQVWQRDSWGEANKGARFSKSACMARKASFDHFCGVAAAVMAWVAPVRPHEPSEPGCYVWHPSGCPRKPGVRVATEWVHDVSGERSMDAGSSQHACARRKPQYDAFCGTSDTEMLFVGTSANCVKFDLTRIDRYEEEIESPSYPNVVTVYRKEIVEGSVISSDAGELAAIGLPAFADWKATDADGNTKFFEWYTDAQAEAKKVKLKPEGAEAVSTLVRAPIGLSEDALRLHLRSLGVDVTAFGQGTTKTLKEFSAELIRGESTLMQDQDGNIIRVVDVVVMMIVRAATGEVLVQTEQISPDGTTKVLDRLPGAKRRPDENQFLSARRILRRQLEIDENQVQLDQEVVNVEEEHASPNFPGLKTVYRKRIIKATWVGKGS